MHWTISCFTGCLIIAGNRQCWQKVLGLLWVLSTVDLHWLTVYNLSRPMYTIFCITINYSNIVGDVIRNVHFWMFADVCWMIYASLHVASCENIGYYMYNTFQTGCCYIQNALKPSLKMPLPFALTFNAQEV